VSTENIHDTNEYGVQRMQYTYILESSNMLIPERSGNLFSL
jgi:hypothetical protein